MKGSIVMKAMSVNEQLALLTKAFRQEIDIMNSLPKDEAQKFARNGLVQAGIVTEDGELTEPYVALGKRYVQ